MRNYKIQALFFALFSFALYAQESTTPEEEANSYRTTVQEKQLEENLLKSPQYKECKDQAQSFPTEEQANEIQKCFDEKMGEVPEAELKKLAEQTNITSINAEQTKTAKGIREYLSEKIARAIQGDDYDPKQFLKKYKYVSQLHFFELYKEQLGKNLILETTNYCLEDIRFIEPNHFYLSDACKNMVISNSPEDIKKCLGTIVEIEFPSKSSRADEYHATVDSLQKITQEEMKDPKMKPEDFQSKAMFCGTIIAKMCDHRYKCQNTSKDKRASESSGCLKDEDDNYMGPLTARLSTPYDTELFIKENDQGIKACNVLSRLRAYKKTLVEIEEIIKGLEKNSEGASGGYALDSAFSGEFQPGTKDQSYSEITTVTSREITENKNIKDLYGLEEEAEKLKAKCQGLSEKELLADKDCSQLVDFDLEKKNVALESSFEAETIVRKKELEKITSKEEMKAFYDKIGFSNLFDENENDIQKLKDLIENHYTRERTALIENMKKQLKDKIVKKEVDPTASQQDNSATVIENSIEDLKNEKDRLGTVLQYNNVISSFLETEDERTKERSTNIVSLEREMEDFDKFKDKDEPNQKASEYFQNVSNGRDANGKKSASGLQYMNYLDTLLGNSK